MLNAIAFVVLVGLGLLWRLRLLRLLVYTMPFIALNLIYSVRVPVDIGKAAALAIIALGCVQLPRWSPFLHPILKKAVTLWAIAMAITAVGVIWAMQSSETLDMWTQSPPYRAVNAGLRYAIFWVLPVAFAMLIKNSAESRILLKDFVRSGIFYTMLGILQLCVGQVFGFDLFPMVGDTSSGSELVRNMVGDNSAGRITSICGEPRYFSDFLTIWLVFTVVGGSLAGLRPWQIRVLSLIFLGTNILTGSRTGLAQLAFILLGLLILCLVQRERKLIRRTSEIVLFGLAGVLVVAFVQGLVLRERISDSESSHVEVAGLSLPIEFRDSQSVLLLVEKPYSLVAGLGAGMWQYQTNPYADAGLRRYYFDQGANSMDSQRQNINVLALLIDFGLVGFWLIFRFYQYCFRSAETRGGLALRREFKPVVSVLVVATAISAGSDIYTNVMAFLVLTLWVQTAAERRLAACRIDSTWKQPQLNTYST